MAGIILPIERGDIILGGKFRNKPIVVDKVGKDEHNQPVIFNKNGRMYKILSVRIEKLMKDKNTKGENLMMREKIESYLNEKVKWDKKGYLDNLFHDLERGSHAKDLQSWVTDTLGVNKFINYMLKNSNMNLYNLKYTRDDIVNYLKTAPTWAFIRKYL